MRSIVVALVLAVLGLGVLAPPAAAQMQGYSRLDQSAGLLTPAAAGGGRSIADMSLEHLVAVGVGAALGIAAADLLIGGSGLVTVVGLVAGALAGDAWYREGLWPFH